MAHASTHRYQLELVVTSTGGTSGRSWWQQLSTAIMAKLAADSPPSDMAKLFAYSYGAAPVPKIVR